MRTVLAMFVMLFIGMAPAAGQGVADIQAGLKHFQNDDCEKAIESFDAGLKSKWVAPELQGAAYMGRAVCHTFLGNLKNARADVDKAVELLDSPGPALALRAALAWRLDEKERAYSDLMRLTTDFPELLGGVEPGTAWAMLRWLKEEGRTDDRFRMLEALVTKGFQPANPALRPDGLVSEYMGALIERGKADEALPLVERIISTKTLTEMRASGRFRPLWDKPAFDKRTQPLPAARRERDHWKAQATRHPDSLQTIHRAMQVLRMLGNFEEAIRMGRKALEDTASFRDGQEFEPWIRNDLAYAYQDLGRLDDAKAVMQPLFQKPAGGERPPVGQLINFGVILLDSGEPKAALEWVTKAKGNVSPYGRKWIEFAEACAWHRLGRSGEAQAALKRMRTKPEENYAALSRALLCLGRVEEVVDLALIRLRDPEHREGMLMALQKFRTPDGRPPQTQELIERWEQVRSHPDVVAEAEKHGRILDIPLYSIYWGDV